MKILIADDDLTSRLMLQKLASNWGFETVIVEDGEAAWEALQKENPPRLLLLDWEMPKLNGLQLSQRIRKQKSDDPPYIILLTGRNDATDIAEGLSSGANDYVPKPFKKPELEARIQVGRRLLKFQYQHLQTLAQSKLAASVFTHALEAIVITDAKGIIIDINAAFSHITGFSYDESIGQNSRFLAPEKHGFTWEEVLDKGHWTGETWNTRKNGEAFVQQLTISAVQSSSGKVKHYIGLFSDVTDRVTRENKVTHAATHDELTGLVNRSLLKDRLQQAMALTQRTNLSIAVAYIDLDGFKAVNDNFGHEQGDEILVIAANNMSKVIRNTDTLARVGGDEFIIVLTGLTDDNSCKLTLSRLIEAASITIDINGERTEVSASIGASLYSKGDSSSIEELIEQADKAMYKAKESGKSRYHFSENKHLS